MADEAERAFQQHDWDNDEGWKRKLLNITLPTTNEEAALEKLKRKYFCANVDERLEVQRKPQGAQQSQAPPQQQQQQSSPPPPQQQQSSSAPPPQQQRQAPRQQASRAPVSPRLQSLGLSCNSATVLCSLLYLIPLGWFSVACYRVALASALFSFSLSLWTSGMLGRHVMSREGAARLVTNDTAQYALYCLLHFAFPPVLFVLIPLATISLYNLAMHMSTVMHAVPETHRERVRLGVTQLLQPANVQKLSLNNASVEVLLSFFLLATSFSARGSFLHFFLHAQFLRLKYTTSAFSRLAWTSVAQTLGSVFHHRLCPGVLAMGFERIKGWVYRYGTQGGLMG